VPDSGTIARCVPGELHRSSEVPVLELGGGKFGQRRCLAQWPSRGGVESMGGPIVRSHLSGSALKPGRSARLLMQIGSRLVVAAQLERMLVIALGRRSGTERPSVLGRTHERKPGAVAYFRSVGGGGVRVVRVDQVGGRRPR
jgi:hypothetical protein